MRLIFCTASGLSPICIVDDKLMRFMYDLDVMIQYFGEYWR